MNKENAWCAARAYLSVLWSLVCLGWGGGSSSNSPTPQPPSEFLYSTSVNGIMAFPVNPSTGALSPGTQVASGFTSIGFLANIVSDPAGKLLFVCSLGDSSIQVFSINAPTGALTPVSGSPFPVQVILLRNLSPEPSGNLLCAAPCSRDPPRHL